MEKKILTAQEIEQLTDISSKMESIRQTIKDCYKDIDDLKTQAFDISKGSEIIETTDGLVCGWVSKRIVESVVPAQHIHDVFPDIYMVLKERNLIIDERKVMTFKVGR